MDELTTPSGGPRDESARRELLDNIVVERGGERLIDGLSLDLSESGVSVLMGPNGAGKSLTLRLLAGLIAPDTGRAGTERLGRSALVFQSPVLLRRTVRANIAHALSVYGVARRERPARVEALLRQGGLDALADRPARALSGGEQQRVAMMRALAGQPSLLLLDEPTASLDPHSTAAIETLIADAARAGVKVVLVTHDFGQARRLADEILFMHRGRLHEAGPTADFFAAPRSAAGRAYLDGRLLIDTEGRK